MPSRISVREEPRQDNHHDTGRRSRWLHPGYVTDDGHLYGDPGEKNRSRCKCRRTRDTPPGEHCDARNEERPANDYEKDQTGNEVVGKWTAIEPCDRDTFGAGQPVKASTDGVEGTETKQGAKDIANQTRMRA